MKGFTLTEFIVVVAIVAVLSIFGMRYYFTYTESYRFQNAISEFKSAVNLARARSMSGIVSSAGVRGDTSTAIPVSRMSYSDATSVILTTRSPHRLSTSMLPVYLTLMGFYPVNEATFTSSNLFPWYINGPQCRVKEILGSDSLSVDVGVPLPSYVTTDLQQTAYAFMNYSVNIRGVESIEGGHYAKAYESGPTMDFQYRTDALTVSISSSDPGSTPKQEGAILFRRGATVGEKTYSVSVSLLNARGSESKATINVLPVGAVR